MNPLARHPLPSLLGPALVLGCPLLMALPVQAQTPATPDTPQVTAPRELDRVTVTGARPSTLPTEIPTTTEGLDGRQLEQTVNATDAQDALKYFPSLLVRKRYIGDYDHAVLATRASGTGNSARSLVFADGVLLSNLLGNGASFTPRWGLVTPEEIERVDVLYGPFSAAYSGNSAGAIVDYVTRMPTKFEAHVKAQAFTQRYQLYGTDDRFSGHQLSASLGDRVGAFSWFVNLNRLDSDAQPIGFTTKLVATQGTAGTTGTPVTGAVAGLNPRNQPWLLFAASSQTHTVQDHLKLKLAYDFTPTLRASYTLATWLNEADRPVQTFVRDAAGRPVYSGDVNVDGRRYTLAATDVSVSRADLGHVTHGLSVKSNTRGTWDWEAAASLYDYRRDRVRAPTVALPAAASGGAGRLTDLDGTGWNTLALKGIWRPDGPAGAHIVEAGLQRDAFQLRSRVLGTADWIAGPPTTEVSSFTGDTRLQSLWAQDAWRFAPAWRAVLGARVERWEAANGSINGTRLGARRDTQVSPKAALSFQASADWTLKASLGKAVRFPTVSELYQGSVSANQVINNDPTLKPERSWTSEWTAERALGDRGVLRSTVFLEHTRDALYSQTNVTVTPNVTNIQNVDTIRTRGLELALTASDWGLRGLDLGASLTYADSKITKNDKFPASVGKWQPRVPDWRASAVVTYAVGERWSATLGARYSGRQYGQLDNSDPNGASYTGFSDYVVADVRVKYRIDKQWSAAFGIDNLNNRVYWAFHPYPQRTFNAELRFDL